MPKFRKKPVVIEAVQFTGTNYDAVFAWADRCSGDASPMTGGANAVPPVLYIATLEGTMRADVDDWIIRGVKGEFYPCKPDIFTATYEPAE